MLWIIINDTQKLEMKIFLNKKGNLKIKINSNYSEPWEHNILF